MQHLPPAQARNVAEAALGPPPLRSTQAPRPAPADVSLFGEVYAKPAAPKEGTEKVHQTALKAAEEFENVCCCKGVEFLNLDDWMVAFAKWTLHPKFLLEQTALS